MLKEKDEKFSNTNLIKLDLEKNNNNYSLYNQDKFLLSAKTINDFENLKYNEIIEEDNRSFIVFFWNMLLTRHTFFYTFFKFSLFDPILIRMISYLSFISITFSLNAVLFNDDYIEQRNLNLNQSELIVMKNDFLYSLAFMVSKSIFSAIISLPIMSISSFLIKIPLKIKLEIVKKLHTKNTMEIQEGFDYFLNGMKIRYIIFFIISGGSISISWYYTMVFCAIYSNSSIIWFYGGVISIVLDFTFQLLKIVLVLIFRMLLMRFPKKKYV